MRGRRGGEAWDLSFGCGFLLHLLTAAFGTKRTSQRCLPMSAFGVKQTSKFQGAMSAFDRKRTYGGAARLGVQLVVLRANSDRDFEGAFTTMIEQKAAALLDQLVAWRHAITSLPPTNCASLLRPASLSIRAREPRALIGIGLGRGRYNGK